MSEEKERVDEEILESDIEGITEENTEESTEESTEKATENNAEEGESVEEKIGFVEKFKKFKKSKVGGIVWQLGTSLLMLAGAALVGIFLAVGKVKGGPTLFAEEYFGYYAANNWYSMFSSTDIEESRFINQSSFSSYMEQMQIPEEVESFEVTEVEKDGDIATVTIDYKTVEDKKGTYTMKLKKQDKNIMLFYTTWKGDGESLIIENCELKVPDGFEIKFDGEEIDDIKKTSEEGINTYKLDKIFKGKHIVEITGTGINKNVIELDWNTDKASFEVTKEELGVSDEIKEDFTIKSRDLLVEYYQASLTQAGSDSIKTMISGDEAVMASIDEQYKAMVSEINKENGARLLSLEIDSYECVIDQYTYMDSASVTLKYTANYNAKREKYVAYGPNRDYEGANSASITVNFKYIDGVWTIVNSNMVCIDYSVANETETETQAQ